MNDKDIETLTHTIKMLENVRVQLETVELNLRQIRLRNNSGTKPQPQKP